jgi:MarR family transcriptional regulator, 2-MHQ and catechol-resistance regulon repressor
MATHYSGTAAERRALNAYIALMRSAHSLTVRLAAKRAPDGLTTSRLGALEALYHLGPMCQKELGDKLLQSGGNITMVIDHLERDGMVRRDNASDDRRKRVLRLTDRGRAFISELLPRHVADIAAEMRILRPSELEVLRRLCRAIGRQQRDTGKPGSATSPAQAAPGQQRKRSRKELA